MHAYTSLILHQIMQQQFWQQNKLFHKHTPWFAGALQVGPDKKIYMAMWNDSSISVIDNPNVYGAGCNFIYQ